MRPSKKGSKKGSFGAVGHYTTTRPPTNSDPNLPKDPLTIMFEHIPEVAGLRDQSIKSTCSAVEVHFGLHLRILGRFSGQISDLAAPAAPTAKQNNSNFSKTFSY